MIPFYMTIEPFSASLHSDFLDDKKCSTYLNYDPRDNRNPESLTSFDFFLVVGVLQKFLTVVFSFKMCRAASASFPHAVK